MCIDLVWVAIIWIGFYFLKFQYDKHFKLLSGRKLKGEKQEKGKVVSGVVYVIDGDTVRVAGRNVRITGLDAPEWDQLAKRRDGTWFNHGEYVKNALSRVIGGRAVDVVVEGYDQYARVLGTVFCENKDVGRWLVVNGYAVAAYQEKYRQVERYACYKRHGMWDYEKAYDPREWRYGRKKLIARI